MKGSWRPSRLPEKVGASCRALHPPASSSAPPHVPLPAPMPPPGRPLLSPLWPVPHTLGTEEPGQSLSPGLWWFCNKPAGGSSAGGVFSGCSDVFFLCPPPQDAVSARCEHRVCSSGRIPTGVWLDVGPPPRLQALPCPVQGVTLRGSAREGPHSAPWVGHTCSPSDT